MEVVYEELLLDTVTPVSLLMAMRDEKNLFLLESATIKKAFSRFTYFGIPEESVTIQSDPFEVLKSIEKIDVPKHYQFGDFLGGMVFLLGYGASNYTGLLRNPIREGDDLFVGFPVNSFVVMDNYKHRFYIVALGESEILAKERLEWLKEKLFLKLNGLNLTDSYPSDIEDIIWEFERKDFEERVSYIKKLIEEGEAIQVVFSQRVTVNGNINPINFYRILRNINPSPYMFFIKSGDTFYLGSSPEVHLKVKNGIALMKPIAGTYPNRGDLKEVVEALSRDEKERAEHLMLVDLARNDLYTYCLTDSVRVTRYMKPEVYSHVVHLVSTVIGRLPDGVNPTYLLKMTFPAGTVSGAPKVRAMEIIDEVEASSRDFYAGCVGYVSFNGNLDTAITIRSARLKGNELVLRAGAGIVYDSVPEREYFEVYNKLGAMLTALERIKEVRR